MKLCWILASGALLLTSCAPDQQQRTDRAAVQASGVSSTVRDKMRNDEDLSLADIESLARARVSDDIVLRYLREHRTIYHLSSADVKGARDAGVSAAVVDYLRQTPVTYAPDPYDQYKENPFYPNLGPGGGGGPGG